MRGNDWRSVETPIASSLYDVETTGEAAYAVGSDGLMLERRDDSWEVLLRNGPGGNGTSLYGVDVTDDGEYVWVVGSSGVVGEYEVAEDDMTVRRVHGFENSYNDVAVQGQGGRADVYVVDESGYVHASFGNGAPDSWRSVLPGSGAEFAAVDFYGPRSGFVADDDGVVYETTDGESWEVSLPDTNVTLYGLASRVREESDGAESENRGLEQAVEPINAGVAEAWVSGDGKVCHYRDDGWDVVDVSDGSFNDVYYDGDGAIAVGDSGQVVRMDDEGVVTEDTPTGETLNGVSVGESMGAVVVGSSGVVIER